MNVRKNRFSLNQSHMLELNLCRSRDGDLHSAEKINPHLILQTQMVKIQLILFLQEESFCIIMF